ncbi:DNA repair protein RadC [Thalassospiraceae bacterium LMO-JJ14]|nr:DNA repair protein RadC [Thalassospiraceae bacterium LMO-JJ14]
MTAAVRSSEHAGHRQRLRTRFLAAGGETMPDYELLEMVLFAAIPRGDVKPLAKRLIKRFGGFADTIGAPSEALMEVQGMGEAAIAALKVVEAAAQRLGQESVINSPVLSSWDRLIEYCRMRLGRAEREHFRILFLNRKNILIADEEQQRGTIDHTPVYPREVVKRALQLGASAIIMLHNHPSGDPEPSRGDIDMTREIKDTAERLGIQLHDHIIVSKTGHQSFKSLGLL